METMITQYLSSIGDLMTKLSVNKIEEITNIIYEAYQNEQRIFTMGNGGSAASAAHFTCDLSKGTIMPGKKRCRAICLTDNVPLITAWANDTNYTNVFGEQLANLAAPGDVLIGLTASGMSPNIINAFLWGNDMGVTTIAMVGFTGGTVKQAARVTLIIPSNNIQHIEDTQMLLLHLIASAIGEKIRSKEERAVDKISFYPSDAIIQERVRSRKSLASS